jgi:DNA-directed RNA polymerase specialized sigma subunit
MPHYVKNKDLLAEVIKSKENGKLTPQAVEMFRKIAKESNKNLSYKNPMDREDCISSAIEDMLKYWDRFDPEVSTNAFAFYSQMAKNGFAKGWKKLHHPKKGQMLSLSDGNSFL